MFKYATVQGRPIHFITRDTDFITLLRQTFDPLQCIYAPTDFEFNLYLFSKQKCTHIIQFNYTKELKLLEMKEVCTPKNGYQRRKAVDPRFPSPPQPSKHSSQNLGLLHSWSDPIHYGKSQ